MPTLEELAQQYLTSTDQTPVLPALPRRSVDDGGDRGWTGLLGNVGEVLAGGQSPTYGLRGSERAAAGSRALLNFGINMMLASGPQRVRPDLFSAAASGLQGAQQSMDLDQRRAQAVAQQDYQQRMELAKLGVEQSRDRIERLKALIPLLQLQNRPIINPDGSVSSAGGTASGGTTAGAPGAIQFTGDREKDRALIIAHESQGDPTATNYVARADPTAIARGATASGLYGFTDTTWREGLAMVGEDAGKYPTARSAPKELQDKVFNAVYDKRGTAPWDPSKWGQNWVLNPQTGRYDLVRTGGTTPTPAPPGARGTQVATATPTTATDATPAPVPPVQTPPAATTAATPATPAATPQRPTTGPLANLPTMDEFVAQNMAKPTPDEESSWRTPMSPDEEKNLRDGLKRLQSSVDAARASYNSVGSKDSESAYHAAQKAYSDAEAELAKRQREALKVGDDRKAKWFEGERGRLKELYGELVKGNVQIQTADNAALNTRKTKVLEGVDSDVALTGDRISSLEALRVLSAQVGKGTLIGDIQVRGRSLADIISATGWGGPELQKKAADVQTFQASVNAAIKDIKSGVAMGAVSDRDLIFLENMVANPRQDERTRNLIITGLIAAQERKRDVAVMVGNLIGSGVAPHQAIQQAQKEVAPIFRQVPPDIDRGTPEKRAAWFADNVRPGQLYRRGDNTVDVYPGPEGPGVR